MLCFDSHTMADITLMQENCSEECIEGESEQQAEIPANEEDTPPDPDASPNVSVSVNGVSSTTLIINLFRKGTPESIQEDLPELLISLEAEFEGCCSNSKGTERTQVLMQLPKIAEAAREISYRVPTLNNFVAENLLPLVLRYIDSTYWTQNREVAQSVLFQFIAQGFINAEQIEQEVWPVVLSMLLDVRKIMEMNADGIMLMCKLGPFLGEATTEQLLLPRFMELCGHDQFFIRKICLSYFGEFFSIVSRDAFKDILFPKYLEMCEDKNWGVRKKCAKVVMSVSCACDQDARKTQLAPAFVRLLQDKNRWVRMAAYQLLGPFISTFADPPITRLSYSNTEDLVIVDPNGNEFSLTSPSTPMNPYALNIYQSHGRINPFLDDDGDSASYFISGDLPDDNEEKEGCDDDEHNSEKFCLADSICKIKNMMEPSNEVETGRFILSKEDILAIVGTPQRNVFQLNLESENCIANNGNGATSTCDSSLDNFELENNIYVKENREEASPVLPEGFSYSEEDNSNHNFSSVCLNGCEPICERGCGDAGNSNQQEDLNLESFNSYNYWKLSPDLPLDPRIVGAGRPVQNGEEKGESLSNHLDALFSKINFDDSADESLNSLQFDNISKENETYQTEFAHAQFLADYSENVPYTLIQHFVSMTDANLGRNTDSDMAYHCAYSLPAVALTLGSKNWYLIGGVLEKLASDLQYKVRRTLAFSLHVLASILGPEIASKDLAPIFDGFIKDLDEVRIGVLKNLSHFFKSINSVQRSACLPKLADFLRTDNERNWRFRQELARQLILTVTLFNASDTAKFLANISQYLLCDKVAAVKQDAILLMAEVLRHISSKRQLTQRLLVKLAERFAHSKKWQLRQTYASLCAKLLVSQSVPLELFASEVMPHLVDLSWDPVANVRLVVAKTISQNIATNEFFCDPNGQYYDNLHTVLRRLQSDKDRDVRSLAYVRDLTVVHSLD